ncbi:MAG: TrmH family RNA methyltransferase [Phycisphaerae bacterium]
MSIHRIKSPDDARIAAYRNLRDRTLRGESLFIAEGRWLVERLLRSEVRTVSLLCLEKDAEPLAELAESGVPIYQADEAVLSTIVGFDFHRGVLACGKRPPRRTIDDVLAGKETGPVRLIVCPEVADPQNLGSIFRIAAGFGYDGVLLGPNCCDAWSRRCLRVSMGAVLTLPHAVGTDFETDLRTLREQWNVQLVGTVLDETAENLADVRPPDRCAIILGCEATGLGEQTLELCDRRVTIPMAPETDSLNLATAAGIFGYCFR